MAALPRYCAVRGCRAAGGGRSVVRLAQHSDDELEAERAKEVTLREDYQKKLAQAVNLDA